MLFQFPCRLHKDRVNQFLLFTPTLPWKLTIITSGSEIDLCWWPSQVFSAYLRLLPLTSQTFPSSFPLATTELSATSAYHKGQQHSSFQRVAKGRQERGGKRWYSTENVLGIKLLLSCKPWQSDPNKLCYGWYHYNVLSRVETIGMSIIPIWCEVSCKYTVTQTEP